ncbi:dioxygenase family protein [Nocardia vaccinii]|uniref:dioxygenase family protein n=1 Tax=Nocardia vaccinii TaxID=1822 RepID=UPI00082F673C|nr:dioxygenase [Nocardia vaccinii]
MSEQQDSHFSPELLLDQVLATFENTPDPRLRKVMQAAVRHLHAFASEAGLQTKERRTAMRFLTAVGQISTEVRQEAELLSDVLGLSSLVETTSTADGATIQTLTGPFYAAGSPHRAFGESMVERDDGDAPALLRGRVTDLDGRPVAGATLDVWQNASNRLYAIQDPEQPEFNLRGKYTTDADGRYEIRTIRPVPYTIPDDGPVGALLAATGRHPWRAAHIHLLVTAAGFRPLTTEVFDAESDYLDSDAVFGVAPELILEFLTDADGVQVATFDIVLSRAPV